MASTLIVPCAEVANDVRLKRLSGLIEADSYACHMLWHEFSIQAAPFRGVKSLPDHRTYRDWQQDTSGLFIRVGQIGKDMPVTLSIFFYVIDGKTYGFWHAASRFVDYNLIREWLVKYTTDPDGMSVKHTNAMNFCNIFH